MLTNEEECYILKRAYIPEHIVGLMTLVSGGEAFLIGDCLSLLKNNWAILVGYPLGHTFSQGELEKLIDTVKKRFQPKYLSLMAPQLPASYMDSCSERESDEYFTLDLNSIKTNSRQRRAVGKAGEVLTVEEGMEMGEEHHELSLEFIKRNRPSHRAKELLYRMPAYVEQSDDSIVLNAWNKKGHLVAFYIVDYSAEAFSAYIIGCHSRRRYAPGASDLLFSEMIRISKEYDKKYIHLGLGVSEGVRRFKKKWGGIPTQRYEMCELVFKKPSPFDALNL